MVAASAARLLGAVLLWLVVLAAVLTTLGLGPTGTGPAAHAAVLAVQSVGLAAIAHRAGVGPLSGSASALVVAPVLLVPLEAAFASALGGSAGLDQTAASAAAAPFAWAGAAVLAAPLGEEFVFRGALWERLAPLGARRQWLGTSALFALWHADPVVVTALIPTSLLLGAIRARHGLGAAVAAHAAHNLVGLLLLLDAPWRHV